MNFRNISAWSIRNPVPPIVFFVLLLLAVGADADELELHALLEHVRVEDRAVGEGLPRAPDEVLAADLQAVGIAPKPLVITSTK
ncbi:MAG: hypothetical protein HC937_03830 [Aquincola sp.]|nr:hypothetical protein [Aquincola sp.]